MRLDSSWVSPNEQSRQWLPLAHTQGRQSRLEHHQVWQTGGGRTRQPARASTVTLRLSSGKPPPPAVGRPSGRARSRLDLRVALAIGPPPPQPALATGPLPRTPRALAIGPREDFCRHFLELQRCDSSRRTAKEYRTRGGQRLTLVQHGRQSFTMDNRQQVLRHQARQAGPLQRPRVRPRHSTR